MFKLLVDVLGGVLVKEATKGKLFAFEYSTIIFVVFPLQREG